MMDDYSKWKELKRQITVRQKISVVSKTSSFLIQMLHTDKSKIANLS
jgi:hypothetical protein